MEGKDNIDPDDKLASGLELWKVCLRRFFWLNALCQYCTDMRSMYGQKRARKDLELEKDKAILMQERCCFFEPDSNVRTRWDILQVPLLLATAILVPFRTGFSIHVDPFDPFFFFDVFSDAYFFTDIVINFRTAYYDNRGNIVYFRRDIAIHYVKGWLVIDLLSCLPTHYIAYIMAATEDGDEISIQYDTPALKMVKILRLFRLTKMIRLLRVKKLMNQYADVIAPIMRYLLLLKLFLMLFLLSHFLGCFLYMFGDNRDDCTEDDMANDANCSVYGWVLAESEYTAGWVIEKDGFATKDMNVSLMSRYLTTFYLTISDFAVEFAFTENEKIWVSIQHILYEAFMAYLTGVFAGEVIMGNVSEQRYNERLAEIREFMLKRNVPPPLRRKVTAFYEHLYDKKTVFEEKAVLSDFPPSLRKEVVSHIFKHDIKTLPFFRGLDAHTTYNLCLALRPMRVRENEPIYEQGEEGREMYIVTKGECNMYTRFHRKWADILRLEDQYDDQKDLFKDLPGVGHSILLNKLSRGSFFGEDALVGDLAVHSQRTRTVLATVDSELNYVRTHIAISLKCEHF